MSWLFRSFEVLSPLLFAEVPLYRMDLRRLALGAEGFAVGAHPTQSRASKIILNGVCVARLTEAKPPAVMTSRSVASPA